jgi:hypothetical protein
MRSAGRTALREHPGCAASSRSDDPLPGTIVQTLSNRADLLSGGAARVQVTLPPAGDLWQKKVEVEGTDVM